VKRPQKGFTLIEMVVVLAIIAILIAIAVPNLLRVIRYTQKRVDLSNAKVIAYCFFQWQEETGITLDALIPDNNWHEITSDNIGGAGGLYFSKYMTGGLPKPRLNSSYNFMYRLNADGSIEIAADDSNPPDAGNILYPNGNVDNYK